MNKDDEFQNFASWKHLLYVADVISQTEPNSSSLGEIRKLLNSLDEHFPRSLSPVDDFQAYAFRQFCKSLGQALQQIEAAECRTPSLFRRWIRRTP